MFSMLKERYGTTVWVETEATLLPFSIPVSRLCPSLPDQMPGYQSLRRLALFAFFRPAVSAGLLTWPLGNHW